MTYKTRKRIWPVAVVSLAVFGLLAAAVALTVSPTQPAQAHGCDPTDVNCFVEHASEDLDPNDPHEHDVNQAPTVSTPVMDPITIVGVMMENEDGDQVNNTETVEGVRGFFSDPDEGDELTFTVGSSNTEVATGMLDDDGNLVITAEDAGEATITVTATDTAGDTATSTIMVTVRLSPAERYHLWHAGDPMMRASLVEFDAPATERVTFTVSAVDADNSPLDEDATVNFVMEQFPAASTSSPLVTRVIGWDSSTDSDIEDDDILQGLLTVRATDPDGQRGFTVYFQCFAPGEKVEIDMFDEGPELVAEATISCKEPEEPPPPEDDEFRSDVMTVVSYNDWDHWEIYETVSDGFLIDDTDNNVDHMVNQSHNKMGILVRDEPVVDDYQLAISEKESLELLPGGAPRRTKAEAEDGQHTIEAQVSVSHVQLTVTSTWEGPAYIRFLDSDMQPFSTDVDEEPMWRGASVVGLDEGRLELNLMSTLSKAKALAYDQYRVVIPGLATGNAYLDGLAGDYYQGTFRFFNPCPSEGHHFYVEVYENEGKYLKTTEKVTCVLSPRPGPTGLTFEIGSGSPGEGELTFEAARNSVSHDVLLIDASNRNIVHTVEDAESPVMFNEDENVELNNGWTYHIVVVAEGANGQFTADGVKDYGVRWLNEPDVALSTDPSDAPDHTHPVCQTGQADVMALLAKCDVNRAPMTVGSIGAQTVMAGESVTVDVASNFTDVDMGDSLTYTAMSDMMSYATVSVSGSMVSITGVAAGSATITVTATDMRGETATQTIMVTVTPAMLGKPTNVEATVDDSDPGSFSVTITWTDGANADGHEVGLVDLADYRVAHEQRAPTGMSHTFTNVASGRYMAIVVSTMDAEFDYAVDIVTVP